MVVNGYHLGMSAIARKRELLENLLRLRRAARDAPRSRDIAAVRVFLEHELGPTVSQRFAAEALGVSHSSLTRWIKTGDIPTVYTPTGRTEIPVSVLLDLYEQVQHERASGQRRVRVLEPGIRQAHADAQRLNADRLLGDTTVQPQDGHRRAELRGLAYHRAVADKLSRPLVDEARQRLWHWQADGDIQPQYAEAWEALLALPLPEIRKRLSEDSPTMRDLRQNSPFTGVLSQPEWHRVLELVGRNART
jgi:hypothetical protein